ncbi:hypothetical protein JCM3765_002636 [Sporobolomyces pararoseus]
MYPGAGHKQYKHTVGGYPAQGQGYGQQPNYNPGYGGPPPPGPYGPPPPQYGNNGGYNPQYGAPPPQQNYNQQMPHPHVQQQQYQAPPQFGGNGAYPQQQQYSAPSMPVPTHYGNNNQYHSNAPSQYQNFQMHAAPQGNNAGFYSNMSGKRKALCIGINYVGTSNALAGCHNDARNMSKWLCERQGYKQEDIVMLLDSRDATGMSVPTKANIIRAMQWLVRDARPNDALFFHYSGHGGKIKDQDGDEEDGYDETIYPVDFKQAGEIVDDEMNAIMVQPLPQGCRLTAIFDCCHSGSALDLPYMYSTQGKLKEPNMLKDAGSGALGAITSYARGDLGGVFKSVTSLGSRIMNGDKATKMTRATRASNADVISFSGCSDQQTSADTSMQGQATGAMSWAFITALTKYPQQSYLQLLNTVRDELKGKYDQKPQLSCSHELDVNLMAVF